MLNLGNLVPDDGEDSIARRLRDLERAITELRAARGLEASTIGAGGLTVKGGSIHITDGGTLTVDDSEGNSMPLAALAFGMRAASVPGKALWTVPNASGGIYWSSTASPEVTVSSPNGRALVIGMSNGTGEAGQPVWSIEARTTANVVVSPIWDPASNPNQIHQTADPGLGEGRAMPAIGVVTLGAAGTYKLRMRFGNTYTSTSGASGGCSNRSLVVFPL